MQFVQGRLLPRYTSSGFQVTSIPSNIANQLYESVDYAVKNWNSTPSEGDVEGVYTISPGMNPKFIPLPDTVRISILKQMLPYHEEWSGFRLEPTSIYGIRVYQNGSSLVMHVDKVSHK
jgi:hypothetical protein